MDFILVFTLLYLISAIVGQNMRLFTLNPKLIHIQSPTIYSLLIFPYNIIGNKANIHLKEQKLMLSELLFCICNQIIIVSTIILQIIPAMPCEVVEFSFGRRSNLDIILDTYNQKIPLVAIVALSCVELLVLFGEILVRSIRNAEIRKKLGVGVLIGILALCLVFLALLIYSIYQLF